MQFASEYTIFAFISTNNFLKKDLLNFSGIIKELSFHPDKQSKELIPQDQSVSSSTYSMACSLSKYDLIIEIINKNTSLRVIVARLNKMIQHFTFNNRICDLCNSYLFCKRIEFHGTQPRKKANHSIVSYSLLNLRDNSKDFENIIENKISLVYQAVPSVSIELFWNMNIFQYLLKISGNSFFEVTNALFSFLSINKEILDPILVKSSTFYNVIWDSEQDKLKTDTYFADIGFETFININNLDISRSKEYFGIIMNIKPENVKIQNISLKAGWYDMVLNGKAPTLYDIKRFVYDIKDLEFEGNRIFAQTVTNLIFLESKELLFI